MADFARFTLFTNNVYVSRTVDVENCSKRKKKQSKKWRKLQIIVIAQAKWIALVFELPYWVVPLERKRLQRVAMVPRSPNANEARQEIVDEY